MIKVVREIIQPNDDAAKMLKDALERIESGELVAVGISWITRDGSIGGDVSSGPNNILMWASLEHNARSFYKDCVDVD